MTSRISARSSVLALLAAIVLPAHLATVPAFAAGEGPEIARQTWTFGGLLGRFDRAQLQRGYYVFQENCQNCHAVGRLSYRNLYQPGGPMFPEEAVKALAAKAKISDGPNDQGKMFKRPGRLSDRIAGPYANEAEARSVHNGAYPPDLSIITKARGVEYHGTLLMHPFHLVKDMATGYQEGGADYLYALLTGYVDVPAGKKNPDGTPFKLADGMNYNAAFPGHQIAMPPPLLSPVKYQDGTPATTGQMARDVVAFLAWAGDPALEDRKRMGLLVMLYLLITAVLLYFAKHRIWAKAH